MTDRQVLVSGAPDRVDAVADRLANRGFDVIRCADPALLGDRLAGVPAQGLSGYVQLPVQVPAVGSTAVEMLRSFLTEGLVGRFEAIAKVLPWLRPDAVVLLVAGNLPPDLTWPDDRQGRMALLRVLGRAAQADAGASVRVRVVDASRSDADVADMFDHPDPDRNRVIADFVDHAGDMPYDDWRLALLSLSSFDG